MEFAKNGKRSGKTRICQTQEEIVIATLSPTPFVDKTVFKMVVMFIMEFLACLKKNLRLGNLRPYAQNKLDQV